MDNVVATIAVIVPNADKKGKEIARLNEIFHEYNQKIIGRMGLPYPPCGVNIINVSLHSSRKCIEELLEKIKEISGITVSELIM